MRRQTQVHRSWFVECCFSAGVDRFCGGCAEAGAFGARSRGIAKEAYIYGFPIVDSYRVRYSYSVGTKGPEYKGSCNTLQNTGGSILLTTRRSSRPVFHGDAPLLAESRCARWTMEGTGAPACPLIKAESTDLSQALSMAHGSAKGHAAHRCSGADSKRHENGRIVSNAAVFDCCPI
jgi:hypothetical protein